MQFYTCRPTQGWLAGLLYGTLGMNELGRAISAHFGSRSIPVTALQDIQPCCAKGND